MAFDDIQDKIVTEKPKKVLKKRFTAITTETTAETQTMVNSVNIDPLSETTDPVNVKPKKKKTSRKKKTVTNELPQIAPELALEIESFKNSDPEALGQAGVRDVKVEVLTNARAREIPGDTILSNKTKMIINDPAIAPMVFSEPPIISTQVITNQNIVLPMAAVKVKNIVAKVVNLETEIISNKVIVQGTIHNQLFFVGTDGIVHHLADDIPFSTFLDIPGVQPGMNAQVTAVIEDTITEVAPDGLSILKKFVIEVFVKITETVITNLEFGTGPVLFLQQVVGENSAQTLVETEVALFTPAIKIDEITGTIQNVTVEIINDKVIIQGILHKQIFFVDTDNLGRHQAEDVSFSLFVDIPGAAPGMNVEVQPQIEAIFFNLAAPAIVRQKAVLEFCIKVTENVQQQVALGTGPLFKVEEFIGENTVQELTENVITLNVPAIKIREIVAKLQDFTTHVINDKVIVQGVIHKQIFFIGTDNIEHHQAEDINFSVFLDIIGLMPGDNVHLNPKIEAVFFELISNTTLRQKVIFAINATITREVQLNLVLGAGPLFKLEQVVGENTKQVLVVRRETIPIINPIVVHRDPVIFPVEEIIGQQQIIIKNTVELPEPALEIKNIQATVINVNFNVITDGVVVAGEVDKTVNFIGTDNIVKAIDEEVPFSILVTIPGLNSIQINHITVTLEDITFNLNSTGTALTQNIVLLAEVEGTPPLPLPILIVTDVTGSNVTETQVLVEGLILTPEGPVFQQFKVVTNVSAPGITGVSKQTVLLQKVGEPAPSPISVVTDVQLK